MTRAEELLDRSGALLNLSFVQRRLGDERASMDALTRAVASALAYLEAFNGEWLLDARSRQVSRIFAEFAWAQARAGAPDQALGGIEAIRSATVRLHTMSEQERTANAIAMLSPIAPSLAAQVVGGESQMYLDREPLPAPESLTLPPITPALEALLNELDKIPTALVSLVAAEARGLTALICWPDGTIESEQWRPALQGPLPQPGYDDPGLFRERRLEAISRASYEDLFGPVDRRLRSHGIERIVLSVPGWLGRFPYEALFDGNGFVGDRYQVLYVPSLRVAADLIPTDTRSEPPSVLLIRYVGDDLPCSADEEDGIRRHLAGQVTVMSPDMCTKVAVLKELEGDYDLIHFCCHAAYDETNPLGAALRLSQDPQDDRQRITAYELLAGVTLKRSPTVTLSACASGVMDLSDTNSAYGLVGGLLRAGARCVIGTRWPVYDDTATKTMVAMYERMAATNETSAECLYSVTSDMRGSVGIEDWAAFGCIGIP